jgi:hypothetical protein
MTVVIDAFIADQVDAAVSVPTNPANGQVPRIQWRAIPPAQSAAPGGIGHE